MHIVSKDGTKIPISKELSELFEKIGCNSHILEQYVFSEARDQSEYALIRTFAQNMEKAGFDKHYIFAFIKTHRMLTEENKKYVPAEDQKKWNTAIKQYDALLETGALKSTDSLIPFIEAPKKTLEPKEREIRA